MFPFEIIFEKQLNVDLFRLSRFRESRKDANNKPWWAFSPVNSSSPRAELEFKTKVFLLFSKNEIFTYDFLNIVWIAAVEAGKCYFLRQGGGGRKLLQFITRLVNINPEALCKTTNKIKV